ncbi:MAG: DUF5691 domain-containing protein [Pseudomonadota bacterium]
MNPLVELAHSLMLGTERRPPALPGLAGALGDVLTAASPPDTPLEVVLLRRAGALSLGSRAGFQPAPAGDALPAPCPPETRPVAEEPALVACLAAILTDGPPALQREALGRLAARGRLLPPALLPSALDLAAANGTAAALRARIPPVLGQRGGWLAGLNPAWSGAVQVAAPGLDHDLWDHGTPEQRRQVLAHLRAADPARARGLLQAAFPQMDARERAALLGCLAIGLDGADEDFLESALADRGKEVRQLAAGLLARLPGSRYQGRMADRLGACLKRERKLLRQVWVLEPPAQFAADWKADALEETRAKSETLGERAWWLYQLARALPLDWWCAQMDLTPAELITWAGSGDWSEALYRAWRDALDRQPNPAWAAAFLARSPLRSGDATDHQLIDGLPPGEREAYWRQMVANRSNAVRLGDLLARMVESLAGQDTLLSAEFSRALLREVRGNLASQAGQWDYTLRRSFPEFACLMPAPVLDEAGRDWPPAQPETDYFNDTLARFLAVVEHRKTLQRFLSE